MGGDAVKTLQEFLYAVNFCRCLISTPPDRMSGPPSDPGRRVHGFSYVLGYSRRQYLHFVESEDLATTLREHVRAFEHFQGLAATCLYDSMKVVVTGYYGEQPIYNRRFPAFATHYGFRPWACRPRHPQAKGKVEKPRPRRGARFVVAVFIARWILFLETSPPHLR
jgi:Integrase core domain